MIITLLVLGVLLFFYLTWVRMRPWRGAEYREPLSEKHDRLDYVKPIPVYIVKKGEK